MDNKLLRNQNDKYKEPYFKIPERESNEREGRKSTSSEKKEEEEAIPDSVTLLWKEQ